MEGGWLQEHKRLKIYSTTKRKHIGSMYVYRQCVWDRFEFCSGWSSPYLSSWMNYHRLGVHPRLDASLSQGSEPK